MAALSFLPSFLAGSPLLNRTLLLLVFGCACSPAAAEEETKQPESSPLEPEKQTPEGEQTVDDPTAPSTDDGEVTDEIDLGDFAEYTEACGEQPCPSGSECRKTRSGEACLSPCPGQPCPPGDGWTSFCDPQGGVTCLQEGEF